jgi:hypothetical protein
MRELRSRSTLWMRLADDTGTHLVELTVASLVMAVAVIGVVGSMGSGMQIVGSSRQRSAGVSVAQERLERSRNIAYDDVALTEAPAHSTDPENPNNRVTTDGLRYRLEGGSEEPLIVDAVDGGLKHLDDPFKLGTTSFSVRQYVTWVDDPEVTGALDYKRVIVVVTWKVPLHQGGSNHVTQSTFVGDGTVTVSTPSATPIATATPTVTPSADPEGDLGTGSLIGPRASDPSPTPDPEGACAGDVSGPVVSGMTVLSGSGSDQGYLDSTTVQLSFDAADACAPLTLKMANVSEPALCLDLSDEELTDVVTTDLVVLLPVAWTIPEGDGEKAICALFEDGSGISSEVWGVSVILDGTTPTVPGDFRHVSCVLQTQNRSIAFQWSASSDDNLLGYRLYRSVDTTAFQLVSTTAALTASDVTLKSYSSVRYVVRAYDKAGTESTDPQVLSYAKNSC